MTPIADLITKIVSIVLDQDATTSPACPFVCVLSVIHQPIPTACLVREPWAPKTARRAVTLDLSMELCIAVVMKTWATLSSAVRRTSVNTVMLLTNAMWENIHLTEDRVIIASAAHLVQIQHRSFASTIKNTTAV